MRKLFVELMNFFVCGMYQKVNAADAVKPVKERKWSSHFGAIERYEQ